MALLSRPIQLSKWNALKSTHFSHTQIIWGQQSNALLLLPALLWIGAAVHLIPEDTSWRQPVIRTWMLTAIPIFILSLLNAWFSLIAILALFACLMMIAILKPRRQIKNTFALLVVIGLFFSLSTGLLVLPLHWIPRSWMISALGLDLFLLGIAITLWDAFDEGVAIRSHLLRSLVSSLHFAGALAALVILAIAIDGELTLGKLVALVSVIAFGILTQTFSNPIQNLLDRLTLSNEPALNDQINILRQTADTLPLLSPLDPTVGAVSSLSKLP
jgi:hypothetical protein